MNKDANGDSLFDMTASFLFTVAKTWFSAVFAEFPNKLQIVRLTKLQNFAKNTYIYESKIYCKNCERRFFYGLL